MPRAAPRACRREAAVEGVASRMGGTTLLKNASVTLRRRRANVRREGAVGEFSGGRVAGRILRDKSDGRGDVLVVQQAEERHAQRRVDRRRAGGPCARGAAGGKPGVVAIACLHAGCRVGGRDPVDHHLGAAEVHVVMPGDDGEPRRGEPHREFARLDRACAPDAEEDAPRRGDHQPGGAVPQAGERAWRALLRDAHAMRGFLGEAGGARRVEREQAEHAPLLLDRHVERAQRRAQRVDGHIERDPAAADRGGLVDLHQRAGFLAGVVEGDGAADQQQGERGDENGPERHRVRGS